jgi:hypothetical protein
MTSLRYAAYRTHFAVHRNLIIPGPDGGMEAAIDTHYFLIDIPPGRLSPLQFVKYFQSLLPERRFIRTVSGPSIQAGSSNGARNMFPAGAE